MHTQVLIIGGGATGTGVARDLALRGVECILVEQGDINAGASGANHGYLHSGARYVAKDKEAAVECREEGAIVKRIAPQCVENTGGMYVAVEGDDENYIAEFPSHCAQCGIPAKQIDVAQALDLEPALSKKTIATFLVWEDSVDPFRLSLENIAQAQQMGTTLLRFTKVEGFTIGNGRIRSANLVNTKTGEKFVVEVDQVVNAAGAWANQIADMAGGYIPMLYSKGTLLITQARITKRVIMRLRPPGDGDAFIPGGTVSIIGTSSIRIDSLDNVRPSIEEVDVIVREGADMIPVLGTTRYIRAYAGVRPLIGSSGGDDRDVSRGYALFDHTDIGLENCATITGGKLTTYRLMAEKTADLVCERLGVAKPCVTHTEPLPSTLQCGWTVPGSAPRHWIEKRNANDTMVCECEMVPRSSIDSIVDSMKEQKEKPTLTELGLRSRLGKGSCQGSFCGLRAVSYLYERGDLHDDQGPADLREFIKGRWKGVRPILWGSQIGQAEIQEALHCGFLGLEL